MCVCCCSPCLVTVTSGYTIRQHTIILYVQLPGKPKLPANRHCIRLPAHKEDCNNLTYQPPAGVRAQYFRNTLFSNYTPAIPQVYPQSLTATFIKLSSSTLHLLMSMHIRTT